MVSSLFHVDSDGNLSPVVETAYVGEAELHTLLERYPEVLAESLSGGEQPRRLILIAREMVIPDAPGGNGRWALDLLFLDQEGIPTLVEIKRNEDTRTRREVVAQMLDYAANGPAFWTKEVLRRTLENTQKNESTNKNYQTLSDFLGQDGDEESFWTNVMENLQSNRIRLVFVVDIAPPELERIARFLSNNLRNVEVFLIGVRRHLIGKNQLLSANVLVNSSTQTGLGTALTTPSLDEWLTAFNKRHGAESGTIARQIVDWMKEHGTVYTTKAKTPNAGMYIDAPGGRIFPLFLKVNGKFGIGLYALTKVPSFASEAGRREIMRRAGAALGIDLTSTNPMGEVLAPIEKLQDAACRERYFAVVQWVLDQVGLARSDQMGVETDRAWDGAQGAFKNLPLAGIDPDVESPVLTDGADAQVDALSEAKLRRVARDTPSEADLRRLAHERVWGSPSDGDTPQFEKLEILTDLTPDKRLTKPNARGA